jgi:hypothetical protein
VPENRFDAAERKLPAAANLHVIAVTGQVPADVIPKPAFQLLVAALLTLPARRFYRLLDVHIEVEEIA